MKLARLISLFVLGALAYASDADAANQKLIAFYAPWDAASLASLQQHADELEAVIPAWISITGPDHKVTIAADPTGRSAMAAMTKPPRLWVMMQNALLGAWDGPGTAALMRDPNAIRTVLDQIETEAASDKAVGLVVDFEDLPASAQPDLLAFLAAARERCRRHGWLLAVTAPVTNPDWNLPALARIVDRVILMAYDEHWQSGTPGPIASDLWFSTVVKRAVIQLPPTASIIAIASYAYDWPAAGPATILSVSQAKTLASQSGGLLRRDDASGAENFSYDAGGVTHQVWMSDASTVRAQTAIARNVGARSTGLWRLGTEDQDIWAGR